MWRTLQARMQGCWDSCTVDVQQGSESPNHVKKHQWVSQCIGSPTVTCWASSHSAHHCDFEWFGFTCSNDQTAAEKRSVSGICSGPNMWLPYWRRWCKIVPWHRLSGFQILRQSHFWEGSKTSCVYLSIWRNLVQPWMPQFFPIVLWYSHCAVILLPHILMIYHFPTSNCHQSGQPQFQTKPNHI